MCDGHWRDGCGVDAGVFGPLALRFRFFKTSLVAIDLPFSAMASSTYASLMRDGSRIRPTPI